jgi:hypothetical protein
VSVRLIHELSVREGEKKSKSQKKVLTIIASLSRFYYIVYIITTTLVCIYIYSLSLINIADIDRAMNVQRRNHIREDIYVGIDIF